jgi:FAD/FMN-containing dehydrogenase
MDKRIDDLTRRKLLARGIALGGAAVMSPLANLFAQEVAGENASMLAELGAGLHGRLILPSDPDYDADRQLWNGMIDKRPLAIAQCADTADVMNTVRFARTNNLPVSVRGGGHNVAGKALRDGALAIDLSHMKGVRVDPESGTARARAGYVWADIDHQTTEFGLATTGGTVSSTGSGLVLGGGIGWLMRTYGLACDNLISVDVVTADGDFLIANENENADLFWAVRGGGGNFGVVTSFEFRLHELQAITAGTALYPPNQIQEMLRFYRDFTNSSPDSVATMTGVMQGPNGTPLAGGLAGFIGVCHNGPAEEGARLLKPIKDFGPPVIDTIGVMPYTTLQTGWDSSYPPGNRNYWRSNFLTELSDELFNTIDKWADGMPPNPQSSVFFEHMGGAISRVGPQETAFSNRDAQYNCTVLASWSDPSEDEQYISWTRSFGDDLKKLATGAGYVNYMTGDEGDARVRATYEENYDRLIAVKQKYDPTNFFSGNQNIAPSG